MKGIMCRKRCVGKFLLSYVNLLGIVYSEMKKLDFSATRSKITDREDILK